MKQLFLLSVVLLGGCSTLPQPPTPPLLVDPVALRESILQNSQEFAVPITCADSSVVCNHCTFGQPVHQEPELLRAGVIRPD